MPRVKPVLITEKPSENEIMTHWQQCFTGLTPKRNHTRLQNRVYMNFAGNYEGETSDRLYKAMIDEGYLKLVDPDPMADAAEEYDMIMKGERTWASILKNSGN